MQQVVSEVPKVQKAQKVGPAPTLVFRSGPLAGERIRLEQEVTTLGRSEGNDCVLADPRISRVHAEIRRDTCGFIVTDLGSRSGTRRNGELVSGPAVVRHGDEIGFGPLVATLEDLTSPDEDEDTLVFGAPEVVEGPHLSPRQEQVLELMGEGLTNIEIGEALGITERTVKAYAQELYDRLGVRNRAGAVAQGAKHGLI